MKQLDSLSSILWNEFLKERNLFGNEHFVEASPAGNFSITDDLINLYLLGRKTAGSSILQDFESVGDPIPKVGNFWIVLNSSKIPALILKTIKIETHKFYEVPERIAMAEGEGDLALEYWRHVHSQLYTPQLAKWGIENLSDAIVITEHFQEVYRNRYYIHGVLSK